MSYGKPAAAPASRSRRKRSDPMRKEKRPIGAAAFNEYYRRLFGDRWEPLKTALSQETQPAEFSVSGGKPYYLDRASIYAGAALPLLEEGSCLDMCAAPGGKTLVLASRMGPHVSITANELSRTRRARLIRVLDEHLPEENRSRITVSGYDAAALPRIQTACYDRILLDAPCSSERHVLTDRKYLDVWSEARIKMLSQRQWALLSAAFLLLKEGGFLVYATCALTDAENDGVIQKLIKKYGAAVRIQESEPSLRCERTALGCRFLPDYAGGIGPLYFTLIEKLPAPDHK